MATKNDGFDDVEEAKDPDDGYWETEEESLLQYEKAQKQLRRHRIQNDYVKATYRCSQCYTKFVSIYRHEGPSQYTYYECPNWCDEPAVLLKKETSYSSKKLSFLMNKVKEGRKIR